MSFPHSLDFIFFVFLPFPHHLFDAQRNIFYLCLEKLHNCQLKTVVLSKAIVLDVKPVIKNSQQLRHKKGLGGSHICFALLATQIEVLLSAKAVFTWTQQEFISQPLAINWPRKRASQMIYALFFPFPKYYSSLQLECWGKCDFPPTNALVKGKALSLTTTDSQLCIHCIIK